MFFIICITILTAIIHELDQSIGKMIRALSAKNMLKDTIIVFSSDNGGPPKPRSPYNLDLNAASNWPLRGVWLALRLIF